MEYVVDVLLPELETKFDITVLYAVEAGSRSTGLSSEISDFDIRFVYCHNQKGKYVSLSEPKDTVTGFSVDRVYDWQGWDIKKSLQLLRQSNPSIIEWLYSPIVYVNRSDILDFRTAGRNLVESEKQRVSLIFHYASMARKNFNSNIEGKETVSPKKYLTAVRGILMMEWQFSQSKLLPDEVLPELVVLDTLHVLGDLSLVIPTQIFTEIMKLIDSKRSSEDSEGVPRNADLDLWITNSIAPSVLEERLKGVERRNVNIEPFNNIMIKFMGL